MYGGGRYGRFVRRYTHRIPRYDTEQWLEERAKAALEAWRKRRRQLRKSALHPAVKAILALAALVFLFVCGTICWILFVGIFLRSY